MNLPSNQKFTLDQSGGLEALFPSRLSCRCHDSRYPGLDPLGLLSRDRTGIQELDLGVGEETISSLGRNRKTVLRTILFEQKSNRKHLLYSWRQRKSGSCRPSWKAGGASLSLAVPAAEEQLGHWPGNFTSPHRVPPGCSYRAGSGR